MPTLAGPTDLSTVIVDRVVDIIRNVEEIQPARVHFCRGYELQADDLPAISVEFGPDLALDPDGQVNSGFTDSEFTVYVDIYDARNDAEAMREIAHHRALIHAALFADITLALPFVIQVIYAGSNEPVSDFESGLPGYSMRIAYPVHYRFNLSDRSAFG